MRVGDFLLIALLASSAHAKAKPPIVTPPPIVTSPAPPDASYFSSVTGWDIHVDRTLGNGCFALTQYPDGTVLRIGLDKRNGDSQGYLIIGNDNWKSLEVGKTYDLVVTFGGAAPWTVPASAIQMGKGAPLLYALFDKAEFMEEFMTRASVLITHQSTQVANLRLDHSQDAGAEILKCQKAQFSSADPFKGSAPDDPAVDPFSH